jgi:hypothetical protein
MLKVAVHIGVIPQTGDKARTSVIDVFTNVEKNWHSIFIDVEVSKTGFFEYKDIVDRDPENPCIRVAYKTESKFLANDGDWEWISDEAKDMFSYLLD